MTFTRIESVSTIPPIEFSMEVINIQILKLRPNLLKYDLI